MIFKRDGSKIPIRKNQLGMIFFSFWPRFLLNATMTVLIAILGFLLTSSTFKMFFHLYDFVEFVEHLAGSLYQFFQENIY